MPGKKCSNCVAYNLDCTYVEAAKVRYRRPQLVNQPLICSFVRNVGPPKGTLIPSSPLQGAHA